MPPTRLSIFFTGRTRGGMVVLNVISPLWYYTSGYNISRQQSYRRGDSAVTRHRIQVPCEQISYKRKEWSPCFLPLNRKIADRTNQTQHEETSDHPRVCCCKRRLKWTKVPKIFTFISKFLDNLSKVQSRVRLMQCFDSGAHLHISKSSIAMILLLDARIMA